MERLEAVTLDHLLLFVIKAEGNVPPSFSKTDVRLLLKKFKENWENPPNGTSLNLSSKLEKNSLFASGFGVVNELLNSYHHKSGASFFFSDG